jgi:hypothetical protein
LRFDAARRRRFAVDFGAVDFDALVRLPAAFWPLLRTLR